MKPKKSSHIGVWLVIVIIAVISYFTFIGVLRKGINVNSKVIDNVSSLDSLKERNYFKLDIPSYVYNADEELNIEVISGQIVTINTSTFVMKASIFVDINADILGLYEESELDEGYFVNDSDIIYFRYRQGYKEYPSCTIINWYTNETSYGLMIEDNVTFEDAIEIIGIDKDKLHKETLEATNNK